MKELDEQSAPSVKQQLAAVRMLSDWLVIGQVVPMNPPRRCAGRDLRERALIAAYLFLRPHRRSG